jgi:replicative DNA helicase
MAQSKAAQQVARNVEQPVPAPAPPAPSERRRRKPRAAPRPRKGPGKPLKPRELKTVLDDALSRMQRRSAGQEKPVPVPWSSLAEALGGGLWGGTALSLVGDTGCGKTQWALQVAAHAAQNGVPVCYVSSEPGVDQVAPRLLALKGDQRWSDLLVGRTEASIVESLRASFAEELRSLPFHLLPGTPSRPGEPGSRAVAEWMRERHKEGKPGERPVLIVQDFVELVTGSGRDQEDFNDLMGRVAQEARLTAREFGVVVLLVSSTSRELRLNEELSIGIHHERRQPRGLGRGNPARLLLSGKNTGDMERESDTVIVLANEPGQKPAAPDEGSEAPPLARAGDRPRADSRSWREPPDAWSRVWCAVAKNRSGGRAWCALRFNGSRFEEDLEASVVMHGDTCAIEPTDTP